MSRQDMFGMKGSGVPSPVNFVPGVGDDQPVSVNQKSAPNEVEKAAEPAARGAPQQSESETYEKVIALGPLPFQIADGIRAGFDKYFGPTGRLLSKGAKLWDDGVPIGVAKSMYQLAIAGEPLALANKAVDLIIRGSRGNAPIPHIWSIRPQNQVAPLPVPSCPPRFSNKKTTRTSLSGFDAPEDEFIITGGKHGRFWLDDGNVVLVAKPPSQTQFRVHQSVLSRQSPVFKELFSYPSRARFERIHGCPVVPLGDTEEDIAALLSAVYDGLTLQRTTISDVETTSGQLRLATKYQISSIRDKILSHLREEYPLALSDVDRKPRGKEKLYDPISVIQLDVPELLPYAWYRLARHSYATEGSGSGDTSRLSNEEMNRLVIGREKLHAHFVQSHSPDPLRPPSNTTHAQPRTPTASRRLVPVRRADVLDDERAAARSLHPRSARSAQQARAHPRGAVRVLSWMRWVVLACCTKKEPRFGLVFRVILD
ncbi:The BTB (BR-C, ttk and bab)/POZ (Pox virus and Zinc finger) domain [Rhizoctonia solani]|uniref:The BTB (BR-C, ttk and bab)/POZ (Pox virus and Zinc finger) domain n=1 Tax=Rhizoctonia solani TaxID=456999 RepID=A0A8H8T1I6_9AGAM|nr:The BTB (BR-C, ttk and bab)/POZ (Pox virus and Zinc finger) domain [Rhizoctonia solani]QRW25404.1 The BTB (BR-C, ttk and bab)/POZ (Pox virus and Zinc finger) domain [Rhizoctonia solani]